MRRRHAYGAKQLDGNPHRIARAVFMIMTPPCPELETHMHRSASITLADLRKRAPVVTSPAFRILAALLPLQ
jgi:hypothetical protein